MKAIFLMIVSVAAEAEEPTMVAPEYSGSQQTIESSDCDVAPRGGGSWNYGRVEGESLATYKWPTEKTGCYLVEAFHPTECKDITLSTAVPVGLTYYGFRNWNAYFDQTEHGGDWRTMGRFIFYGGHPGVLTIGGRSPEYVDTGVENMNWIAPQLRVSWWNTGCGMRVHTEEPKEPSNQKLEIDSPPTNTSSVDEDLVPELMLRSPKNEHEIDIEIHGCYLLEAKFQYPYTFVAVTHGHSEATTQSLPLPGSWEVIFVRYFRAGDELEFMSSDHSEIRFTFVGHKCGTMRDVSVRMMGNFTEAQLEHVSKNVVRNVAEEKKVPAVSIVKRRVWKGSININLYTFGVQSYEATTLCGLVNGTSCEAKIINSGVIYNHLIFHDMSRVKSIAVAMYILLGVASMALIFAVIFLSRAHCDKRQQHLEADLEQPKTLESPSTLGISVAGEHDGPAKGSPRKEGMPEPTRGSPVEENAWELSKGCETGHPDFVIGRPCKAKEDV